MKQRISVFLRLAILFVAIFAMGKVAFFLYNSTNEPFTVGEMLQTLFHGLPMDLSTAGYLLLVPWLVLLVSFAWQRMPLRAVLSPYYIIVALVLAAILVGDMVMYGFWKFKLDHTVFNYLDDVQGATNSVSLGFIALRLMVFLLVAALIAWVAWRLTPKRIVNCKISIVNSLLWLLVGGLTFLAIRGGWGVSTMNVGNAYYSQRLYLNHAAVNPAFSLFYSVSKNQDYSKQYQLLDEEACAEAFDGLYPAPEDDELTDTLLSASRPNVLVVLMEGFYSRFIREQGGLPDVAPNLSRLIPQGVFFDQMYANSFRTDRGTVSTFSGYVSYPSVSLMRIPGLSTKLPGLARSLQREGYSTHYIYGGDINFTSTSGYLVATGYERLISDKDFSRQDVALSKWGANDSVVVERTLREIHALEASRQPWHVTMQMLSSHEPWDVPYHRLPDEVENAFAYADHCLGRLVDSLQATSAWDNMLVVFVPDHGILHGSNLEDETFFHCPLLLLGGAIREPRRIDALMNQSDLAATLLAQMGISHTDYPWSRNVLSKGYSYPFAYCTSSNVALFKDSTGVTLLDLASQTILSDAPAPSPERLQRLQAILQTSYQELGKLTN